MNLWSVVRVAALVLASALAVVALDLRSARITAWFEAREPKVKTDPLPLGGEILRKREARLIGDVTKEYGRVKANVEAARAKGFDVSRLDRLLFQSLSLAKQKRYEVALTLINRIDMGVPRPSERVVVARPDDPLPKEPELRAADVPRARSKGKGKARGKARRRRAP